jgi:hypothetical protein
MPIAISALAGFAGAPDNRPGYRSDRTANNRPFNRVAGHCGAYSCAAQAADGSALFGAGACRKRNEQAQNQQRLLHWFSPEAIISRSLNAPRSFSIHRPLPVVQRPLARQARVGDGSPRCGKIRNGWKADGPHRAPNGPG